MMNQSFTTAFLVDRTPREAFDLINNVRGWWSEAIEGGTDKLGDEFTFRHKDIHYSKQKIIEVAPGKKVVWLVVDANLNFTKDKTEWKDTKVIFEISRKGNKTEVSFTHQGLVPAFECFDACSSGWGFFVNDSLRSLIATGKGKPLEKRGEQR